MSTHGLPRPFGRSFWPSRLQEDAQVLWAWHDTLWNWDAESGSLAGDADRAAALEPLQVVPAVVYEPVYRVIKAHKLNAATLGAQLQAADRHAAPQLAFQDSDDLNTYLEQWPASFGWLLAGLAGAARNWQRQEISELSKGLFLTGRLIHLPEDIQAGRLYLPLNEVESQGLTTSSFNNGPPDAGTRKLLWRLLVRAQDALGQGQNFIRDLERPYRGPAKRTWLGAVELLRAVERRNFDVWSGPIQLPAWRRAQLGIYSLIGKLVFK